MNAATLCFLKCPIINSANVAIVTSMDRILWLLKKIIHNLNYYFMLNPKK